MHRELRFIKQSVKINKSNNDKLKKKKTEIKKSEINKSDIKRNMLLYKKIAVSVMAAVFLAILYMLIFSFSEQDGEASGSLSRMISEKCVEIMNTLSGKTWSYALMESMTEYFENPIRKLAHFMEYACMAVLVFAIWRPWKERNKRLYLLVILWVAVSAAGDEFHQLFVPGRYGSVADVFLDTCGGCFGMWLCVLAEKLIQRRKRKIENRFKKVKK